MLLLLFLHTVRTFFQTDQLIIRLQVVATTNFIRMLMRNVFENVFKSDEVIWWAAIFRTISSMFDRFLHLSKSGSFAMSCSRRHDLREAVGNLLTVTMYFQNSSSRFHRPGLRAVDLRVHVASASTRTFTNPTAAELSVHRTIIPGEHLHKSSPLVSRCDSLASSTNQCHTGTQTNHVLLLGRRMDGIPRVFSTETFGPNCNSRTAARVFDVSSPISVGHHHDRTLRNARKTRNINICNQRSCCTQEFQSNIPANA